MQSQNINGSAAWKIVEKNIEKIKSFTSVKGIKYEARLINGEIFYKGGDRNNGNEETISKSEFISAFDEIRSLSVINTNTIKEYLPKSLYRKRTPFIGLLLSSGIIK